MQRNDPSDFWFLQNATTLKPVFSLFSMGNHRCLQKGNEFYVAKEIKDKIFEWVLVKCGSEFTPEIFEFNKNMLD